MRYCVEKGSVRTEPRQIPRKVNAAKTFCCEFGLQKSSLNVRLSLVIGDGGKGFVNCPSRLQIFSSLHSELKNTNAKLYTPRPMIWSDGPVPLLGVNVSQPERQHEIILSRARELCESWKYRTYSLQGRVLAVNAMLASKFVHTAMVTCILPQLLYQKFRQIITNFIWNNRKPKIAYETLCLPKSRGGMGLIDLRTKHQALIASWIYSSQSRL